MKILNLLILLLITTSCSQTQNVDTKAANRQHFEILYLSEYGGEGIEKIEIFDDSESFTNWWQTSMSDITGSTETPKIDFQREMVIAKHFQSQRSGGTNYQVESVQQAGNTTTIYYSAESPESIGTTAITSPLMVVVVQKTEEPLVEFKLK